MHFIIKPYESVGGIHFGDTKDQVRSQLGNEYKEFKKSETSINLTDDFGFCHVFYNQLDTVDAIEFFRTQDVELHFQNLNLLSQQYTVLKDYLAKFDSDLSISKDGCISMKFGIAVYAPSNAIETILVFKKGYYN